MNNTFVCPHGRHSDKIDKVSYIYKSQTRTREVTEWVNETYRDKEGREQSFSYPRSYDVVEITNLAKQLSPPQKPSSDLPSGGCLTLIGVILLLAGITGLLGGKSSEQFLSIVFAAVGLILCMKEVNDRSAAKRKLEDTLPRWQRAMTKWNQLYYCAQHDIFFNPYDEDRSAMPVSNLTEYLYTDLPPSQKNLSPQKSEESSIIIICENCGQKLRIPLRRKNIHVTCPKCKHEFNYEFIEGQPIDN